MGAEPVPAHPLTSSGDRPAWLRGVHQEMMDAALAGGGLDRIAEVAAARLGRPVAIVVPERAAPALAVPPAGNATVELLETLERYQLDRVAAGAADMPPGVGSSVDISTGGEVIGGVYMLGGDMGVEAAPAADADEVLHLAAFSAMTILALEEAREREAVGSGFGLIEELRQRDLERDDVVRRGARLGSNLDHGAVAIACDTEGRKPREAMAVIARECPGAVSARIDGRVLALLPAGAEGQTQAATLTAASGVADRLRSYGRVGLSSFYADPAQLRRAIHEAELVLEVASSDERVAQQLNGRAGAGVYRLLFRALASHPEEVRAFYEDTVAAIVGYDRQYHTDLLQTLESYLEHDCNMNATARAIYAHRHTVAYRLQRVRELTGLDPLVSEDRERLGLGLKAYRIVAPGLPR